MIASPFPRQSLLYAVKTLPAAPQILARLGQMLLDLNTDLDDIVALLRRDAALTAAVMRVANSAAYNSGAPYLLLEDALARVGLSEVYRFTGFAAVAELSDRSLPFYGVSSAQLRENSLFSGLVMEALARRAKIDTRAAYTAGLLRSTGKIALDRLTRDRVYGASYVSRGRGPLAEWETDVIGLGNCEAAAVILEEWHFPGKIVAAIRDHYVPGPESSALASLLNLAAGAAADSGLSLPGEQPYWAPSPEKFAATGLDQSVVDDAVKVAQELFGPIRAALA